MGICQGLMLTPFRIKFAGSAEARGRLRPLAPPQNFAVQCRFVQNIAVCFLKSYKMPNHTNTWSPKRANFRAKIWTKPHYKREFDAKKWCDPHAPQLLEGECCPQNSPLPSNEQTGHVSQKKLTRRHAVVFAWDWWANRWKEPNLLLSISLQNTPFGHGTRLEMGFMDVLCTFYLKLTCSGTISIVV